MLGVMSEPTVWTIGHSTRSLDEFVDLLREHGITRLVDIRTVPGSRHNPQYGRDTLPPGLEARGIAYVRLPGLGGLRHTSKDSVNTGWRNASFRGYADYMQTPEFSTAVEELLTLAAEAPTVVMCAEAVPWRCHRSMVGDALLVRGVRVLDIMGPGKVTAEKLTSFAHVEGTTITYPPED
ncbi:hypothetical protein MOPEL_001_00180 [Mobilicoccus pelagius NBRC 104925]|uniref:HhH-GPD domain-containing protein n=2 Tax=Mobilicoccus TaxID=984996 RepID=H5UME2_9MICO|nr:hypothetical protein MOPEL_001_00180 [Mobilicoccus pelagius NBRC 104925]